MKQDLVLQDCAVIDEHGVILGEFDEGIFVPSIILLMMDIGLHDIIEAKAYALPGAPVCPTEEECDQIHHSR